MNETGKKLPLPIHTAETLGDFWQTRMRSPRLLALLLTLSTALVYLPVAWNQFVNYDDPDYITSNPHVSSGLSWENVKWAFYAEHSSNWHPLTWISHMIDCQIFGQAAASHHLVNAAFHLANTLLLFFLLKALTVA